MEIMLPSQKWSQALVESEMLAGIVMRNRRRDNFKLTIPMIVVGLISTNIWGLVKLQ
jgi:hypothetical protein